jgi:hypothetical protein
MVQRYGFFQLSAIFFSEHPVFFNQNSYLWLCRKYYRSEKSKIFWFFARLFVPLWPIMMMVLKVIPIMWRAVRPSRIADMPAVVNTFWLRKGFQGLTFFGHILTSTQAEADLFNAGQAGGIHSAAMKNHEMIHLRQAQSCSDSWLRFYLLYIWYWLKISCLGGSAIRRQLKHAGYLLNPFELEAYGRMYDLDYLDRCEDGAQEWRRYAKMPLHERMESYKEIRKTK